MRKPNTANRLNVLFLSSCDPCDIFLIKEVMTGAADCANVCGIIRPFPVAKPALNWRSCLKQPAHRTYELLNSVYQFRRDLRKQKKACRLLFGQEVPELQAQIIDVPQSAINRPQYIDKIASFRPDVIVISGAAAMAPAVLSLPRMACLNLHGGIAPEYRGEHAQFWPLWLGDYQNIGFTIHAVAKGNLACEPLVRGYPALSAQDTELSIAIKSLRLSAQLIREVLQNMQREGKAPALRQLYGEPEGQLIEYRDRTMLHDLAYTLRRYLLGRHPPEQAQRIERFYRDSSYTVSAGSGLVKPL
jgi:folate-dependent phosphoribosylglycinamide formyltransferase PurN